MGGQIIDASLVACPKQRNNEAEKAALKQGRIPEGWAENPNKLAQKDRDARWTVKWSKAKPSEDSTARARSGRNRSKSMRAFSRSRSSPLAESSLKRSSRSKNPAWPRIGHPHPPHRTGNHDPPSKARFLEASDWLKCCARSRTRSRAAWLPSQAHAAASSRLPPRAEASPLPTLPSSVREILDRHSPSVPPLVKAEGVSSPFRQGVNFSVRRIEDCRSGRLKA